MPWTIPGEPAPVQMESKDPDAKALYKWDWATHIGAATITSATVTVRAGTVTTSGETIGPREVSVLVDGGALGEDAEVECRVSTSAGEENLDATMKIPIVRH